ncbi:MAG: hypothetical protein K0S73_1204 [Stenotrophomonas rhizophila]|jgi:glycosyltransferase involved in cell wall biosynthesis|uniref:glycosyltransferase n=1 Tax=Stenotrophomonas sp. SrG TaxID=3414430 RepID=UPI0031BDAC3A|nr:hypothetical protein [Stenotrophomonas rhizophila]
MIGRVMGLARRVSVRQLFRNPRAELGRILGWVGRRLQRVATLTAHGRQEVPAWLREEMVALASIEPALVGEHGEPHPYGYYGVPFLTKPGELYRELQAAVGARYFSHVMVLPWLVRGGADRGALHHLKAWSESMPVENILLLLTEDVESAWLDRVPEGIKVVSFGRIVGSMVLEGRVQLLTRLLVQMQPEVIHTINSRVAWQSFKTFGLALRQESKLFASLYCDDYSTDMVPVGYARSYLRECHPHLTRVFCDNTVYPVRWAHELGVPLDLFSVLRFPHAGPVREKTDPYEIPGVPRVLWAGRFDRQKRLDVLAATARAMPTVPFDVHGVSDLGSTDPALALLTSLPNVTLHGAFSHFESILRPDHAAYLFTSAWEGLPTILLDAAAAGVPIVAPAVGGVVDLIEHSWLVDDPGDVGAFQNRLERLREDPQLRRLRRRKQYDALSNGRSWEDFIHALQTIAHYLPVEAQALHRISQQGSTT